MDDKITNKSLTQDTVDDWNLSHKSQSKAFIFGGKLNSTDTLKPLEHTSAAPPTSNAYSTETSQYNQPLPTTVLSSNHKDFEVESNSNKPFPSYSPYIEFKKASESFFLELNINYLKSAPISFGRSADIIINHSSCSRFHAQISQKSVNDKFDSLEFYLTDTSSSNGTFLNSGKLSEHTPTKLEDCDEIIFGLSEDIICFKDPKNGNYKNNLQSKASNELATKRSYNTTFEGNKFSQEPNKIIKFNSSTTNKSSEPIPERIRCRHILKKHLESRNPFDSFRKVKITRTKNEAIKEIIDILKTLESKPSLFSQFATSVSECSSARNGGDLGHFNKGQMQKAFEEAAFSLKVGEISKLVDSPSGIHAILRIE